DAAHVRAAAARDPPLRDNLASPEADYRDRALAAVGRVQELCVATRVEAVDAQPGSEEADHLEPPAVDLPQPVRTHVGDVEDLAVRRQLDVLRHARATVRQVEDADDALALNVDLDQLPRELAARDQ